MELTADVISDVICPWCYNGHQQTMVDVVAEAGLDRQSADTRINSDAGLEVMAEAGKRSRRHQVNGVPFFIVYNTITMSGAQASDTFLDAFKQAHT